MNVYLNFLFFSHVLLSSQSIFHTLSFTSIFPYFFFILLSNPCCALTHLNSFIFKRSHMPYHQFFQPNYSCILIGFHLKQKKNEEIFLEVILFLGLFILVYTVQYSHKLQCIHKKIFIILFFSFSSPVWCMHMNYDGTIIINGSVKMLLNNVSRSSHNMT